MSKDVVEQFCRSAVQVGSFVKSVTSTDEIVHYVLAHIDGSLLVAPSPSLERTVLLNDLKTAGANVVTADFREKGAAATAGITGANFGIAQTGTVVLESTSEAVRICSMLPEKHFVVLDPDKLVTDADSSVPLVRKFHELLPQAYLAYLTGPSRTADIERVLTIGVHGPKELHILLLPGLSNNYLEN